MKHDSSTAAEPNDSRRARRKLYLYGTSAFVLGLLLMVGGVFVAAAIGIVSHRFLVGWGVDGLLLQLAGIPAILLAGLVFLPGLVCGWRARKLAVGLQDMSVFSDAAGATSGASIFSPAGGKLWIGYFGLVWCSLDTLVGLLLAAFGFYVMGPG